MEYGNRGAMEYWSIGVMGNKGSKVFLAISVQDSITPIF